MASNLPEAGSPCDLLRLQLPHGCGIVTIIINRCRPLRVAEIGQSLARDYTKADFASLVHVVGRFLRSCRWRSRPQRLPRMMRMSESLILASALHLEAALARNVPINRSVYAFRYGARGRKHSEFS